MGETSARRGPTRRVVAVVGTALLAMTLAAGCAGPEAVPYSDFDRAQDSRDVLPDLGRIGDGYDPASIRFVGTSNGLDVYLATMVGGRGRCVVVAGDTEGETGSGCGDEISIGTWTVQIHPDDVVPDDSTGTDWTALGENVSIRSSR
jgi:hypothetical protein